MIDLGRGTISGLVAAGVVSAVIVLGWTVGVFPEPDPLLITNGIVIQPIGLSWVIHFGVGTFLWGMLFALLSPILPGPSWGKGALFGAIIWCVGLAGAWYVEPSAYAPINIGSLALHLLFGVVLGRTYGALYDPSSRRAPDVLTY
ncbi:DUF6789 family protein [Microvirga mediterraneensis]|uniref:Uncharacterized protein n=1 Tax=Microvirga mediterraneensis TaxID=2754695 RepID=A0A838BW67_9HYPH|nr:DUF6789 family protein [Microvirga mediterraneensis]MBA1159319.1 hypothetical protein [Microvirga mediterraneensis]